MLASRVPGRRGVAESLMLRMPWSVRFHKQNVFGDRLNSRFSLGSRRYTQRPWPRVALQRLS